MNVFYFLLYLLAGICFGLAAGGVSLGSPNRKIDLVALGLLFWVAVEAIQSFRNL